MLFTTGMEQMPVFNTITPWHITGMAVTLVFVALIGILAGKKVKTEDDFTGRSRKASSTLIAGTIMGTLVGGASTIGTAQLAYQYGFCAWWMTLGAGIGCLALALVWLKPLYKSNQETIPQYLVKTYGPAIGPISSIFTSAGMCFNTVAQGMAAVALLTTVFRINAGYALMIAVVLVLAYVLAGGVQGTGMVGVVKLILLYGVVAVTGILAYQLFGGINGLSAAFPQRYPWFSLFGRGLSTDLAAGFSLLCGVLSTQTYIQAIMSGKTVKVSRKGAVLSSLLIPPIGVGGILVGLYMRANTASFPGLNSCDVLPVFVLHHLPPVVAGIVIATLLIAVIGTWAGVALGISTMLTRDIYKQFINKKADSKSTLLVQRGIILATCLMVYSFISLNPGGLILDFSYLSMGLRGCTVLFPMLGAIFFNRFVTPAGGIAAAILGPLTDFGWHFIFPHGIDALYPGLIASLAALVLGSLLTQGKYHAAASKA
ncbi:MAG: sodium:solute symporter family protein [Syntrophomonas sp.]